MTARHVIVRADASATVGTGHVVRCRTLAEALVARGWRATLVTRDLPDGLAGGLDRAGIAIVRIPGGSSMDRTGRDRGPASTPTLA